MLMLLKSNKIYELKQIVSIFPKIQLRNLISDRLKEIMQLQINIKLDNLEHTAERGKRCNFSKYFLSILFLRDMQEGILSLEDADEKESELVNELQGIDKGKIPMEESIF